MTMHSKPNVRLAFASVEYIMRDVNWCWLIRYMPSTGASAFFVVVYLHMFRGLFYGSFKKPREFIWLFGMFIFLALMAEAFMGYLLPWGQMSYWGAQVIVNLFGAIPFVGEELSIWIRGDYVISDATLNRFFAFHVAAVPLVIIGLVVAHVIALHEVGSNNPDGVEIKKNKGADGILLDGIPFHPYYTVKDIVGVVVFLMFFAAIMFFGPEMGGYFLEHANFVPADPLKTPEHIAPVWYFTPFYTMLRAVPDPFLGVVAMGGGVVVLAFLPWLDNNPIKSVRYRSALHKLNLTFFVVVFIYLGYFGVKAPEPVLSELGLRFSEVYFVFFYVLWFHSKTRDAKFSFMSLIIWMVLFSLNDFARHVDGSGELIMMGWFIPGVYLAVMFLAPLYTNLNAEKAVPERVTG